MFNRYFSGMKMQTTQIKKSSSSAITKNGEILGAAILGVMIFLFIGFSPMEVLHNAAHDTRHSTTFPCH